MKSCFQFYYCAITTILRYNNTARGRARKRVQALTLKAIYTNQSLSFGHDPRGLSMSPLVFVDLIDDIIRLFRFFVLHSLR